MQIRISIQRQLVTAGIIVALSLCTHARAQVLDQVPSDALAVLKIKDLDGVSKKAGKMAKGLGLDAMYSPAFGDPLGAVEDEYHIAKGVDRSGDLAVAFQDPEKFGGKDKSVLVLVPIQDYKAFLGNFDAAETVGDVTKARPVAHVQDVYIAQRGNFAAISLNKDLLTKKPDGMKLSAMFARQAESKDAILYLNVIALRAAEQDNLKKNGDQWASDLEKEVFDYLPDLFSPIAPVVHGFLNAFLGTSKQFLTDGRAAVLGVNLSDDGVGITALSDFDPDSSSGKLALEIKNTDQPLLAGLPNRKYFAFGGAINNPDGGGKLLSQVLGPIEAELADHEQTKKLLPAIDSLEKSTGTATGGAVGWVAPTEKLGAESVLEFVVALHGDAKTMHASVNDLTNATSGLFNSMPPQKGFSVKFEAKPNGKTVDGVKLDTFQLEPKIGEDDPTGAQVKQILDLAVGPGPNSKGLGGVVAEVDDKTLVLVLGGSDPLIAETIASAKNGTDAVSEQAGVKAVAGELPKNRSIVAYIDLDAIAGAIIHDAKNQGMPLGVKLRPNLPPIGLSAGSEGSAIRADAFIPNTLLQGLMAAYIQGLQQMNNGPGGGL
jgi:hypothetical protein